MVIIHIETKAGMSETALNDLKEVLFEQVEIKDGSFIAKQMELNVRLQNLLNNPESLVSHEQVWQDIDNNTDKKIKSRNRKFGYQLNTGHNNNVGTDLSALCG